MRTASCTWTIVCDTQAEYDAEIADAQVNELCSNIVEDAPNKTFTVDVTCNY